jgi:hypothetical protein
MAIAVTRPAPGGAVVTSNQASIANTVAATAAGRPRRSSRRSTSRPVASRLTASRPSSPVQAAAQWQASARPGSMMASQASHGIIPIPAATRERPSQRPPAGPGRRLAGPGRFPGAAPGQRARPESFRRAGPEPGRRAGAGPLAGMAAGHRLPQAAGTAAGGWVSMAGPAAG